MNKYILTLFLVFSTYAYEANHNLVIIKVISSEQNTFIIRKGLKDQVYLGQKSLFSTEDISFQARVKSVNRFFSQWEPVDGDINIPFDKGEVVNMSVSTEKVWSEIPRMVGDKEYRAIVIKEQAKIEEKNRRIFGTRYAFHLARTLAFNESTTASLNNDGERNGITFKAKYIRPLSSTFAWNIGFRYDTEVLTLPDPEVDVETQRHIFTGGVTLRFPDLFRFNFIPYANLELGAGRSQTVTGDFVKTGSAMILPSLNFGMDIPFKEKTNFSVEVGVDNIISNEKFSDGVSQSTNMTIAAITLGLEFR